jgi:hypothetical protein
MIWFLPNQILLSIKRKIDNTSDSGKLNVNNYFLQIKISRRRLKIVQSYKTIF